MCFAAGRLQGWAAKLLLARRKSWYNEDLLALCLTANGPVVWGVAVGACPERSEGSELACVFAQSW